MYCMYCRPVCHLRSFRHWQQVTMRGRQNLQWHVLEIIVYCMSTYIYIHILYILRTYDSYDLCQQHERPTIFHFQTPKLYCMSLHCVEGLESLIEDLHTSIQHIANARGSEIIAPTSTFLVSTSKARVQESPHLLEWDIIGSQKTWTI